jgi:hypothetical protein
MMWLGKAAGQNERDHRWLLCGFSGAVAGKKLAAPDT